MNPDGLFHPKLYLFEYKNGDWECVTGSPNFTQAGFSTNNEVAVHFGSRDVGAASAHIEIVEALNAFRGLGKQISEHDLLAYRATWKRQQRRLEPLSGTYSPIDELAKPKRSPLDVPIFVANWAEYVSSVNVDTEHTTEGRLTVLEEAQRLFSTHSHFNKMIESDRKGIAGFGRIKHIDWLLFGSMKGAGYFKQAINSNSETISLALDEIPLTGEVTHEHFARYLKHFRQSFDNSGIATATRLLAMKRPDCFVCLDSRNRRQLCEAFDIPKSIDLDDYWDKVVQRIIDSNWWNAPEPKQPLERRIWKCRAAFLDVRFYEPK